MLDHQVRRPTWSYFDNISFAPPIPEPSTVGLFGVALLLTAILRQRFSSRENNAKRP